MAVVIGAASLFITSMPAHAFSPTVGSTPCVLVPKLTDVTVNQGLGSYNPFARGKDTLVKFYLSLPDCADTVHGDTITITSPSTAPTQLTASGVTALNTQIPPFTVPLYNQPGFTVGPSVNAPYVNQPADPVFIVPAADLAPSTDTSAFTLSFQAAVNFTGTPGSGSLSTPAAGPTTFSTQPGTTNPIKAQYERRTNALRVLVVEMVDPLGTANTFGSSTTPNAHTAVDDGMLELSRMWPLPSGVSTTLTSLSGGLRYQFNAGALDLRSVSAGGYTYNLIDTNVGDLAYNLFCGSSNFDVVKVALENYRQAWNAQNPSYPADRVLGVVDQANSGGSGDACPDGMASMPSFAAAATQAWVRACYSSCIASTGQAASITGSLIAMEMSHTVGLVPQFRDDGTSHSPNVHADTVPTQTLNRAFYLTTRSVIADNHTVMDYTVDPLNTSSTWNNTDTVLEQPDYDYLLCALGGGLDIECSSATNTIGTVAGVPAAGLYTLSGSVGIDPSLGLPTAARTTIADSFVSPNQYAQTPTNPNSSYRLLQCSGTCASSTILRNDGIPVSFSDDDHNSPSGATAPQATGVGGIQAAVPFSVGATRIELRFISGTSNILLYARDNSNGAPQVVPGSLTAGAVTPGQVSEFPVPSTNASPTWISQGPDGNLWFTEQGTSGSDGRIASISQAGTVTEYPLPVSNVHPYGITLGPDGNIWFAEGLHNSVGEFNVNSHTFTEFPLPAGQINAFGIIRGLDANLWITVADTGQIDRMTPAGAFTTYAIPVGAGQTSGPENLTEKADPRAGPGAWELDVTDINLNAVVQLMLPSGTFTEYPVPTANAGLYGITMDRYGNTWATELRNNAVVTNTSGSFVEYPMPTAGSVPAGITSGAEGNLWVVEEHAGRVAELGVGSSAGQMTDYALPTASGLPLAITAGQDGNLWATEEGGNRIARITGGPYGAGNGGAPEAVAAIPTIASVSVTSRGPNAITSGPDGNLWLTEWSTDRIARETPGAAFTEFPLPTAAAHPGAIAGGPDGNVWFTESSGNAIGRVTPTGAITEYPIPTPATGPAGITAGPDGQLWFTESGTASIGALNPSTGVIVQYPLPTQWSQPTGIAPGPDGRLWFTEAGANQVGAITTAGLVSEYTLCPSGCTTSGGTDYPHGVGATGIAAGPDGNLWVTESNANSIDKVSTGGAVLAKYAAFGSAYPEAITAGPDGNMWYTLNGADVLETITTNGSSAGDHLVARSTGVTTGPDHNIWSSDNAGYSTSRTTVNTTTVTVAGTTASGNGLQNLRADFYYRCPGSNQAEQPVAVGVTGQQSGAQVDFSTSFDTSASCGGTGTLSAIVNDGFQQSAPSTTAMQVAGKAPVVAVNSPTSALTLLPTSRIPLHGVASDALDGTLTEQWTMTDASGAVVAGGGATDANGNAITGPPFSGDTIDLMPPPGGWSPGSYVVTSRATNSAGVASSSSVAITVLADRDHDGIPDIVEQQACFPLNHDSDPYEAWQDYDGDGIPNIDDPSPCVPATVYMAQETFQPDHLNVYSNGQPATVDITLNYVNLAQVLPATVQVTRIEGQAVSGFTAIHWSVVSPGSAVAQFDRQSLEAYLVAHNLVNRTVAFEVDGQSASWTFDGGCSTYVAAN